MQHSNHDTAAHALCGTSAFSRSRCEWLPGWNAGGLTMSSLVTQTSDMAAERASINIEQPRYETEQGCVVLMEKMEFIHIHCQDDCRCNSRPCNGEIALFLCHELQLASNIYRPIVESSLIAFMKCTLSLHGMHSGQWTLQCMRVVAMLSPFGSPWHLASAWRPPHLSSNLQDEQLSVGHAFERARPGQSHIAPIVSLH